MPPDPENSRTPSETYEEAVQRTGRKYPWRTSEWPCPACGKADCDLDAEVIHRDYLRWTYRHVPNLSPGAKNAGVQPKE